MAFNAENITVTFPTSIKSNEYCFVVNTDDLPQSQPLNEYLKSKGVVYTKTIRYSKTKLMGWHVYKIKTTKVIKSFDENIEFCNDLLGVVV